jgi:hypothetical protein
MTEIDEKIINEGIRIPFILEEIKTHKQGGHNAKIHFPESALAQVKQLSGTENKVVYMAVLVKLEEIERVERGPGRPKKARE